MAIASECKCGRGKLPSWHAPNRPASLLSGFGKMLCRYWRVQPNLKPDPLVKPPKPDIAHRDLAGLAFDLEADEPRLVIDGVSIVVDEDGHELAVHHVHHHTASGNDLIVIPFV